MKTVAVIEGFAGGPMHTRQFRKALKNADFKIIKDRKSADIIIAHSAGIYGIPPFVNAKLLILIGPTYWPGKPLLKRMAKHARISKQYHVASFGWRAYMYKKILEFYYFFRRHGYMWLGIINNNRLKHLIKLIKQPGRKTIVVRNRDDPFSSPEIGRVLRYKNVRFVELPGVHDDYLTNPLPYIDLLNKEL